MMRIEQDLRLPDGREVSLAAEGWPSDNREGAEFFYTEGNGACDCSLSDAVKAQVDPTFTILPCGQTIELLALRIDGVAVEL